MAPLGNQNALKLKTPELKAKVYKDYCDHLAEGYPATAWTYDSNGLTMCWDTIEKYIREDSEFDPHKKTLALAKGYKKWVTKVMSCVDNRKSNVPALQMFMRNVYGWDKEKREDKEDSQSEERKVAMQRLMNHLKLEQTIVDAQLFNKANTSEANLQKS